MPPLVDASTPPELIEKYVALGLPAKADAHIGAFTEWMGVQYLISDNRHFLSLTTEAFEVLRPGEFLHCRRTGMLMRWPPRSVARQVRSFFLLYGSS